uniref:Uncharacterized protein n=1 Tax=Plectus sambesii TaxID=2011161 RepID=A0A914VGJ6_9BILA
MYPQTGTPVQCPTAGSTTQCPTSNRYCMYSASFGFNICCSTSTTVTTTTAPVSSTQACPASGIAMYPASANYPATPLVCTAPGSTTQCPASN